MLLVGWGSTQGPIREAVDRARAAGDSVSSLHIRHINPLPPGLENIFAGFQPRHRGGDERRRPLRLRPAGGAVARPVIAIRRIRGMTKTDGLTWQVREILERAEKRTFASNGEARKAV